MEIRKLPELIDNFGTTADFSSSAPGTDSSSHRPFKYPFHLRNPIPHLDNSLPQILNTRLSPCRTIPRRRCRKRETHIPPLLPDQNANAFQVLYDPCAPPQPEVFVWTIADQGGKLLVMNVERERVDVMGRGLFVRVVRFIMCRVYTKCRKLKQM